MPAEEGKKAPAFSLPSSEDRKIGLKDFVGQQPLVLYFYPKDNTSGCTREACDFRDNMGALQKEGVAVVGISPDSVASHKKFIEKQGLNFPLLADENHEVCEKYGVWKEKSMYGRKYFGVERSTFLIGRDGKIAKAWRKVKVPGHVDEVKTAIKQDL